MGWTVCQKNSQIEQNYLKFLLQTTDWNYCECPVLALPLAKIPGMGIIFDITLN